MMRLRIQDYYLLLVLLLGILCAGCTHSVQQPTAPLKHLWVPINCKAKVCTVQIVDCKNSSAYPDPAWISLHSKIRWEAEDGHKYSIHFKDRTPIPSMSALPAGIDSDKVMGDSKCSNPTSSADPSCDFPYYLNQDDTNTQCSDPIIHVVPE